MGSAAGLGLDGAACLFPAERDQDVWADGALRALQVLREHHRGQGRDGGGAAAGLPRRGAGAWGRPAVGAGSIHHGEGLSGSSWGSPSL